MCTQGARAKNSKKKMEKFPGKITRAKTLGTPITLSAEQAEWLCRYYPRESSFEIGREMGCARHAVERLALDLGLEKDRSLLPQRYSASQKKLYDSERRRLRWGLPRKTALKLKEKPYTRLQVQKRWKALTIGYVVDADCDGENRYKIYFNENTKRSKFFERCAVRAGFTIEEWKDD